MASLVDTVEMLIKSPSKARPPDHQRPLFSTLHTRLMCSRSPVAVARDRSFSHHLLHSLLSSSNSLCCTSSFTTASPTLLLWSAHPPSVALVTSPYARVVSSDGPYTNSVCLTSTCIYLSRNHAPSDLLSDQLRASCTARLDGGKDHGQNTGGITRKSLRTSDVQYMKREDISPQDISAICPPQE